VRLLVNHTGVPLARTKSGTLQLESDDIGLRVRAELDPSNPAVAELRSAMARGDLDEMSFGFRAIRDQWSSDYNERTITEVKLYDVSLVTYPANPATVAQMRATESPQGDDACRRRSFPRAGTSPVRGAATSEQQHRAELHAATHAGAPVGVTTCAAPDFHPVNPQHPPLEPGGSPMLEQIRSLIAASLDERAKADEAVQAILSTVEAEGRGELTEDETASFDEKRSELTSSTSASPSCVPRRPTWSTSRRSVPTPPARCSSVTSPRRSWFVRREDVPPRRRPRLHGRTRSAASSATTPPPVTACSVLAKRHCRSTGRRPATSVGSSCPST
jgi:HK97 family phage prohead protease